MDKSGAKDFRLVEDVRPYKVLLVLFVVVYSLLFIQRCLERAAGRDEYMPPFMVALTGLYWLFPLCSKIKVLAPHQQKRLTLGPEGVAYSDQGKVEWQIAWADLHSVVLKNLEDGINGDTEDLIFATTSGEVHSIPTLGRGTGRIPQKKKLLAALAAAGFEPRIETEVPGRQRA